MHTPPTKKCATPIKVQNFRGCADAFYGTFRVSAMNVLQAVVFFAITMYVTVF
jgi:small-conductance mechanosensitive channel